MSTFGETLRAYREQKRMSQFLLASEAGVSSRHLSFLETGRSSPSRDMVLQLGTALQLGLRDTNTLLQVAGFSAEFSESLFGTKKESLAEIAVNKLLDHQDPYPAVAFYHHWEVYRMNAAGLNLMSQFPPPKEDPVNLLYYLFDPEGIQPFVENFDEVARHILRRMTRDRREEDKALFERVLSFPDAPKDFLNGPPAGEDSPVLPLLLNVNGERLSFLTVLTSFGAPQDISLEELRLETYFPMDEPTERWCRDQGNRLN